jgi:hypothetical protein
LVKRVFLILLASAGIFFSYAADVSFDNEGITVTDSPGRNVRISDRDIEGKKLKKISFPPDYYVYTSYPATELYERIYYFAVPEGGEPSLNFSVSGGVSYRAEELMPAAEFTFGKDGMATPFYLIPEKREDELKPYAEITFHGYMDEMKLYKLIFRPVVSDGEKASVVNSIKASVKFASPFSDRSSGRVKETATMKDIVLNYAVAIENPVRKRKLIEPVFLDRQTEWIRLKIKDEGIYRVSGAALRNAGIDIGSVMSDKIRLFSGAGKDIDNNPTTPVYHGALEAARKVTDSNGNGILDDNDHIIFYATGTTSRDTAGYYYNKYSEHTYYWIDPGIGSSELGKVISAFPDVTDPQTDVGVFKRYDFSDKRNEVYYKANRFTWYNLAVKPLETKSISFNMKDISGDHPVTLKINHSTEIPRIYTSSGLVEDLNRSVVSYSVNGNLPAESALTVYSLNYESSIFSSNSSNTLSMTNLNSLFWKYYLGYELTYYGTVSAGASDDFFYNPPGTAGIQCRFILEASTGRELFNITDPLNIRSSVIADGNVTVTPETVNSRYLLFSGSYRSPVEIKKYDNTVKPSLHSQTAQIDMVIISPPDFYDFFINDEMGYIGAHIGAKNDVRSIKVVSIDDISNEFGRGYQEPAATRNFIKYAKENWGTEYFLLAGDGNYYIKNEIGIPEKSLIYPSDTWFSSSVGEGSDDFYANLDSTSPAQHVSIGRFTVSNLSELRSVVSKTVEHLKNKTPEITDPKFYLSQTTKGIRIFSGLILP